GPDGHARRRRRRGGVRGLRRIPVRHRRADHRERRPHHRLTYAGTVPELPEVESARAVIERAGLGRLIVDVDDTDSYECRPHPPGEIRSALVGRKLTAAHRRGKSMWCDTGDDGPLLGIHLGMSGKIVIAGPD